MVIGVGVGYVSRNRQNVIRNTCEFLIAFNSCDREALCLIPVPDIPGELDETQEMSNAMNIINGDEDKEVAQEIREDVEQGESFGVRDSTLDPNNDEEEERTLDATGVENDASANLS